MGTTVSALCWLSWGSRTRRKEYQKALAIMKKLADANRARSEYQSDLAACHNSIGDALSQQGKPAERGRIPDGAGHPTRAGAPTPLSPSS